MARFRRAVVYGAALALVMVVTPAWAKDFYVDPAATSSGDGSAAKPWRSLQEVIDNKLVQTQGWNALPYVDGTSTLVPKNAGAPVKPGDTIYLRSGFHGSLTITDHYNSGEITIAAAPGATAKLSWILIRASAKWRLRGLSVSPSFAQTYERKTMIKVESHGFRGPARDVVVENNTLRSVADISAWTASDWDQKAASGIGTSGPRHQILGNTLENVNFGISVSGPDTVVRGNTINRFSGDGLRGLGDRGLFEGNLVKNCYDVNANHDDGFQSWSTKNGKVGAGEVTGVVLRGNTIINYEDPKQPMRCTLQGIGMFDGTFVDWVIENNVIITDHWHGITLMGARNCRVVNNTVLDPNNEKPGPPWIRITKHKNGTATQNCVVRNNLATAFSSDADVTSDHNIVIKDASKLFVDVAAYDVHLLPGSAAIDKGSAQLAPAADIEGTPRPQGAGVDVGAYEWHEPKLDAGVPDGAATPDGAVVDEDGGARDDAGSSASDGGSGAGDGSGRASASDGCAVASGLPGPAGLLLALLALAALRRRIPRL